MVGMTKRQRVGVLVFPDVDTLDFCGPYEVFSVARLHEDRRRKEPSPFEVMTIAEQTEPVSAASGLVVIPHHTFADCPSLDILVVPGGWGVRKEIANERLIGWIRSQGSRAETITSVCTGAMLLGAAGLLDGRKATTHWQFLDRMRESFPSVDVQANVRVVQDGPVITSAGISAGIDMALTVVARYHGVAVAEATARHMEYPLYQVGRQDA